MPETESKDLSFDNWLRLLKEKLPQLGYAKNLAFAASCCERSLPNYEAFSNEERWGDSKTLREALELLWRLATVRKPAEAESYSGSLLKALDAITPDTENFKSRLTSAALDAGVSVSEALEYARGGSVDHVVTVSSLARDTIDLFLQLQQNFGCSGKALEDKIAHDPLMVRELLKQQADVRTLESAHDLAPEFLERFRQSATNEGRSNLGISRSASTEAKS